MQKILSAAEMREVDRLTTEKHGIPSIDLMENAARAAVRVIIDEFGGTVKGKSFVILCGTGNNGGDGAAAGRLLAEDGAIIHVLLLGKTEQTRGDAKINFDGLRALESTIEFVEFTTIKEINEWWKNARSGKEIDVIIDAVFGTGLNRPMEDLSVAFLESARDYTLDIFRSLIVSLDLPSGLNSDQAEEIGYSIDSDVTVTFTAPKIANVLPPAIHQNGSLHVVDIGSPKELIDSAPSQTFLTEVQDVNDWLCHTRFRSDSYKNKRGHALLIVGSRNYSGAAVLAGNGAMATGVGLVTIATSKSALPAVSARVLPEVMTQALPETKNGAICFEAFERLNRLCEKTDVLAIGSGLGSDEETTRKLVREVIEKRITPVVIDADGLNALSPFDLQGSEEFPLILTPHEGEFLRLLGTTDREVLRDRIRVVRDFAEKHHVILILKGERTLIAEPSGKVLINPTGNPGLGKAGNGDNLTGIITGFVAQTFAADTSHYGLSTKKAPNTFLSFVSVAAAVYTAGLAGDIAEKKYGKRTMLASDVRESLAEAFRQIEEK